MNLPRALRTTPARVAIAALVAATLPACTLGPAYQRPSAPTPSVYKEAATGWLPAAPADTLDRGDWWMLFGDAELNRLMPQVEVSNQNVAFAVAAYAQARALVRQQRASLFPAVALDGGASRSGGGTASASGRGVSNSLSVSLGASWEPDVWGRLRLAVASAQASVQASEADLAAARLSARAELATDYFALREADAEAALLRSTVDGYQRSLKITQNSYNAGIIAKTDLLQAETTLANAQADLIAVVGQRAQLEHAIAVLAGQPPGDFSVAVAPWTMRVPLVPPGVPSTLLQRRPDIASAERSVAAANTQIGIQRAGYFPSFSLSGSYGFANTRASDLFNASRSLWSIGLSVAQTVFDAGATRARVEGAEAGRDEAVAHYRQTVLAAFQSVEDQLSTSRVLSEQESFRRKASEAADLTEQQLLNRYRAGQVSYTDVVTAQASALSARRTLVQLVSNRQASAIALIQDLGGGWHATDAASPAASIPSH